MCAITSELRLVNLYYSREKKGRKSVALFSCFTGLYCKKKKKNKKKKKFLLKKKKKKKIYK